jgi:hypothetical protein
MKELQKQKTTVPPPPPYPNKAALVGRRVPVAQ